MNNKSVSRLIHFADFMFFDKAIRHDISKAISAKANFLTALGLVSYTEFIGGILRNNLGVLGESEKNFNKAFYEMGNGYREFDKQVVEVFGKNFYKIIRCGLVHEYFAKEPFSIAKVNRSYLGVGWAGGRIGMANQNYYDHLTVVIDKIKGKQI